MGGLVFGLSPLEQAMTQQRHRIAGPSRQYRNAYPGQEWRAQNTVTTWTETLPRPSCAYCGRARVDADNCQGCGAPRTPTNGPAR